MAPETATHQRIYRTIKEDYLAGAFGPGARIQIPSIARRANSSVTPVREALYRLVGEGLVEADPDGGFRSLFLTSTHLPISMPGQGINCCLLSI